MVLVMVGKKIFFLLGHFEKIKVEEAITKAIRNYCKKKKKKNPIMLIVRVVVLVIC